jgi:integrase
MAAKNITTTAGRVRLAPHKEPYWHKISKGRFVGFRKLANGGTWVARFTSGKAKSHLRLGTDGELPEYDDALKLAREWFNKLAGDLTVAGPYTVRQCIADYVADLRLRAGDDSATRIRQNAEKHIIPTLGKIQVSRLSTQRLKTWRDGLVAESGDAEKVRQSKDTANRILRIFTAALNRAFRDGTVASDSEWRRVKAFPKVSKARDVFLTAAQCRALIDACTPDFGALVESAVLTGARLGELATATVKAFDTRQGTLHVDGKTGPRDIVLSDDAVAHLKQLCRNKLPGALIHVHADGRPWKDSQQCERIDNAVIAANAKISDPQKRISADCVFYSLRHSHASMALLAGVIPQALAENMGTSTRMLELHYAKFFRSDKRQMFNSVKFR